MKPVAILACLRSYPDANITVYHRAMKSTGAIGGSLSGGATLGCTLNYTEPELSWAGRMAEKSVYLQLAYVGQIRHLLTEEEWHFEPMAAGGTIYRLKPEFIPAVQNPYPKNREECEANKAECERILATAA